MRLPDGPAELLRLIDASWQLLFPEEGDEVWLGSSADLITHLGLSTAELVARYVEGYLAFLAIQHPKRVRREEGTWVIYQQVPDFWF